MSDSSSVGLELLVLSRRLCFTIVPTRRMAFGDLVLSCLRRRLPAPILNLDVLREV